MSINQTVQNQIKNVFSTIINNKERIIEYTKKTLIRRYFVCGNKLNVYCYLHSEISLEINNLKSVVFVPLRDILKNDTELMQYLEIDTLKVDAVTFEKIYLAPSNYTVNFSIDLKNQLDKNTLIENLYEEFKQNRNL